MENCVCHPSPRPSWRLFNNLSRRGVLGVGLNRRRRPFRVKASECEFSSLNSPLEPKSDVGKVLSGVLQNHRHKFHVAVAEELKLLVDDRDAALARMLLSTPSHEASLHRRIAEMKEHECEIAVQDVMHLLIFYKFSEIRVPLVPKLCRCMYNGRLEILPSKHWELESIYSLEILDMIREHVTSVTGLRAKSSVTASWATTEIKQFLLARIYVASILYGYFLKSLSLRHHLERSLCVHEESDLPLPLPHTTALAFHNAYTDGIKDVIFANMEDQLQDIKCYVMGSLQRCAKLRSKEAVNLVETYTFALFSSIENDDVILTSFSTLKRLVLEAVAFGSFLWDTEDYIDNLFLLPSLVISIIIMIVLVLRLVIFASIRLWSFLTRLIFSTMAYLLVLLINGFKGPGDAVQGGFQQMSEVIRACFKLVLKLIMEAMNLMITKLFDIVKQSVIGTVGVTGSVVGDVAEKMKTWCDEAFKCLAELSKEISAMLTNMFKDFWNNYNHAVGYVKQNIA
ncbi:UV-B-induced protein [Senna tora]|uniref:UV-B-induced protein n=1 Tax=Senna tora TaxID=362788 RepID=A0A834XKP2_9FABA|nr:UV-B-induced protein [Senna tora]